MSLIWTAIVGLVIGAIAKLLMPGRDPGGILITMLLGVAGAMLASFLGRALGLYERGGEGAGIIMSIVGAVVLLGVYRLAVGRRLSPGAAR